MALTAAWGRVTAPPPVLGRGVPGPEIISVVLDTPWREMMLSTAGPTPRSCFTNRDSTLHPFASCLPPPPTPSASPKEKKKPEGTVASWWWNKAAHCPAQVRPARDLTACHGVSSHPSLVYAARDQGLNQSHPAGWAVCAPLLPCETESHDVFNQSQRNPNPSSLFGVLEL